MEAAALYDRFKTNLDTINMLLERGTDIRTTSYNTTIPLEVGLFCEVLGHAGVQLRVKAEGITAISELQKAYKQQESEVLAAMEKILKDKRSSMKTSMGTLLLKEVLIRRLEYFNETARSMMVMTNQTTLKSPVQHIHPHHRDEHLQPRLK